MEILFLDGEQGFSSGAGFTFLYGEALPSQDGGICFAAEESGEFITIVQLVDEDHAHTAKVLALRTTLLPKPSPAQDDFSAWAGSKGLVAFYPFASTVDPMGGYRVELRDGVGEAVEVLASRPGWALRRVARLDSWLGSELMYWAIRHLVQQLRQTPKVNCSTIGILVGVSPDHGAQLFSVEIPGEEKEEYLLTRSSLSGAAV
jgi:hypothetical protein